MYYLVKFPLYLLSLLPFPVLYLLSDVCAFFMRNVFRYRREIVEDNIRKSFPEKTESEIQEIVRGFYINFTDVFIETLKLLSMRKEELKKRVRFKNPELIPKITEHGGGAVFAFGHLANWEWLGAGMGLHLPFKTIGIYRPLSNTIFDRLMLHIRTRMGNRMVTAEKSYRDCLKNLTHPCCYGFLTDQNPTRTEAMFFAPFLGRPVPVHLGIARIVQKTKCPFFFFGITRTGRGFYEISLTQLDTTGLLNEESENTYRLTLLHMKALETAIRSQPANWLWSHKRWKHQPRKTDIVCDASGQITMPD